MITYSPEYLLVLRKKQKANFSVRGKSFKYNQLVQNGNFEDDSGWSKVGFSLTVSNNEATLTSSATDRTRERIYKNITAVATHKYVYLAWAKTSLESCEVNFTNDSNNLTIYKNYTLVGKIATSTMTNLVCSFQSYDLRSGDTITLKNYMLIDLTELGLDSITSLDQFYLTDLGKAIKSGLYLPYGSDIYSITSPLKFSSENSSYSQTTTLLKRVDLGSFSWRKDSYNRIQFITGQSITDIKIPASNIPANVICSYYTPKSFGTYEQFDKSIAISSGGGVVIMDSSLNSLTDQQITDYFSGIYLYYEPAQPIQLCSVNNIYDTYQNANGKITRRIGVVDLGSLSGWTLDSTGLFQLQLTGANLPSLASEIANIVCSKYQTKTASDVRHKIGDKMISGQSGYLSIHDTSFAGLTFNEIKPQLSGVYLIYELANPTTEYVSSIMLSKNVSKVEDVNGVDVIAFPTKYKHLECLDNIIVGTKYGISDLGKASWAQSNYHTFYNAQYFTSMKIVESTTEIPNFFCSKYTATSFTNDINNRIYSYPSASAFVYVRDDGCSDTPSLDSKITGLYFIYELAEPNGDNYKDFSAEMMYKLIGGEENCDILVKNGSLDILI